jgi:DNA-binding transcriptional LysR family regulator
MKFDDKLGRRVKLREMRILLAAVRWGSLAKAAENLGLSQPAISKAIAGLEDTFGGALLDRSHAGVQPTAQGKILLQRAMNIFDELRLAGEEMAQIADPTRGSVRVACAHAVSAGFLPRVLDALNHAHPGIRYSVLEAERAQIFRALRAREVDLVVARPPVEEAGSDLAFDALYEEKLYVVAGARHPLANRRRRLVPAELASQDWILPTADMAVGQLVETFFRDMKIPVPQAVISSMSIHVTCALLDTGRFVSVLPGSLLAFAPVRDALRVLPANVSETSGPVGVTTVKHRRLTPVAKLFVDHARKIAAQLERRSFSGVLK